MKSTTPESEEDRLELLSRRIEEWLTDTSSRAETLRSLVSEVRRQQAFTGPAAPRRAGASAPGGNGSDVARFARALERSSDQAGILSGLVEHAAPCASRILLFIVRGEAATGWAARGFPGHFGARSVSLPLTGAGLVSRSQRSCAVVLEPPLARPGNAELIEKLGGATPVRMMAAPLWVRDRVAAVLYADGGDAAPWQPDSLCVMASLAALSLEVLPVRQKHPRPTAEPEITLEETENPFVSPVACDTPLTAMEPGAVEPEAEPADEEQAAQREEALRFARLLASEIVLYNAAELEDGRRHKDIYQRLKDEIDRSHQMFSERFSAQGPGTTECFRKELVRVLAEGDETALTLPWS